MSSKPKGKEAGASSEDGDFVALRARREARKEEPIEEIEEDEVGPLPGSDSSSRPSSATTTSTNINNNNNRRVSVNRPVSGRAQTAVTRLFDQAVQASVEEFERLLSQTLKPNLVEPLSGQNVLLFLLANGRADLAKVLIGRADVTLLTQDCDVTVASLKGKKNALHYITELNNVELARETLNKITDPKQKQHLLEQETPVQIEGQRPRTLPSCHLAAFKGCKELVALYLDNGVKVNAINSKKDTALLWAARWNHLEVVQELLRRHADANIENDKGSTALYWAVRYGHSDTVRLLITVGKADVNKSRKLGLVSPIIVACALGYLPIVKLLIEGGADPNVSIRGKETPLHHAAREGYSEIVDYLLQRGAKVDEKDEGGDTALLHAARHGHARCLQVLLGAGAKHTLKNHSGADLMSLAVASDNNQVLKIVLGHVKVHGSAKGSKSPLLLSAAGGQTDKIKSLLAMGLEADVTDDEGNTMMHYAAMENQYDVILKFSGKVKIDAQNSKGNTALHEACARGHSESISALISSKATASISNSRGETALHLAAYCKHIQPDTVRRLMDYVIKSHAWESLNIKDTEGKNALHIAAKVARPEVMWEFRHVPFKVKDADGNIALHEAVRAGEPEALSSMLDIYESMKRDADINEQNNAKETVLQLAAQQGFSQHVPRLVLLGADLDIKGIDGNTVLHKLTQLSATYPQKSKTYLAFFQAVLDQAAAWWCMKRQLHFPHGDTAALDALTRQASLHLLTQSFNSSDNNVLAMACQEGAADIVSLILSKRGVMCFQQDDAFLYNVTNMTPLTNNSVTGCCTRGSVVPRPSYIEFLLSLDHPEKACRVLDIQPFKEIERAYSSVAAWTYVIIMLVHIVYMSFLSASGVLLLKKRRLDPSDDSLDAATVFLYAVAPLEPALILLYHLYQLLQIFFTREMPALFKLKRTSQAVISAVFLSMPILLGVLYSLLVILWILLHQLRRPNMDYVFSVAVCLGWMYTISFTRGIRIIHYFWRMIQNMIVKDIFKFLFIYLFVLLAFTFAFHAMFQASSGAVAAFSSPFDTGFLVFNLMIGMGELFFEQYEDSAGVGSRAVFVKVLYVIYMVLGTILLLNLLIAMMNDSYASILRQHSVTWRIESVQLGVDIEKTFPLSTRLFSSIQFMKNPRHALARLSSAPQEIPPESGPRRDVWYISIPARHMRDDELVTVETELEALREVRLKVGSMEQRLASDLQQVKHDLDDFRSMLRDLTHQQPKKK